MRYAGKAMGVANKIRFDYQSKTNSENVKWTDVYADEAELLNDLMEIHVPQKGENFPACPAVYKGYEYIHSFAKRVQVGSELTEKQMKQAKRLAVEIKIAWTIREYW